MLDQAQEFGLTIPGLTETLPMARDFLVRVVAFADFAGDEADRIVDASLAAIERILAAVEAAGDVDLPLSIRASIDRLALEIAILEEGLPLGDSRPEADLDRASVFDRIAWTHRGPQGSELHLTRSRPHPEIRTLVEVEHRLEEGPLERDEHAGDADRAHEYTVRPFEPSDALEVSRRIYEAYGYTYPNPDVFFPERIAELNRTGRLISVLVEADDGRLVGHEALERPDLGPIAESGLAVVDRAHRGRGIMKRMRAFLGEEARRLGLRGTWSQPTARHPFSQKMNIRFGATAHGLTLGTTPAGTILRGSAAGDGGRRESCFLYWDPLDDEPPLTARVPARHAEIVSRIYAARQRAVEIDTCTDAVALPAGDREDPTGVRTSFDPARRSGRIRVLRIGAGTPVALAQAARMLERIAGAEAIYLDLPIDQPGGPWVAGEADRLGFVFSGIGPAFAAVDGGDDTLRLQRMLAPVDMEGIVVEGDLGAALHEHVVGELAHQSGRA